jgi:hypothetical protein
MKARTKSPTFAPGAAEALLQRLAGGGESLGVLNAEIKKLQALAKGKGKIDRAMVASISSESTSDTTFSLLEKINRGKGGAALEMLRTMLRDGAVERSGKRMRDPRALSSMAIGTFAWDLRQLWKAWSMLDRGCSVQQIKSEIKGWGAQVFIDRARRTSFDALARRHDALRKADSSVKSGARDMDALAELVATLADIRD